MFTTSSKVHIQEMPLLMWIMVIVYLVKVGNTQTYENVTNLRSTLLMSYDPDVLPLDDQSKLLNINLTTYVFMISDVDQVQGGITMGVMVTQEWFDERLTWTPADHGGITMMSIKSENIWTPPLTVSNPVKFMMLDRSWMQVMVMDGGKVMYTVGGVVSFKCSFYMKFWPFDKQVCSLNFFVYGYASSQLSLSVPGTVVNTDYYYENGEWYLDKKSFEYRIEDFFGGSQVMYTFKLDRLSSFYLITVIMPVNGIGALICLAFLLPSESGERVGYSITIMLSLTVFLTLIAQELPKNSEPVPIMCLYILFNMIVCICASILVIVNLTFYHRNESVPVTRFYKTIVRFSRCQYDVNKIKDVNYRQTNYKNDRGASTKIKNVKTKIYIREKQEKSYIPQDKETFNTDKEITWKDVSRAIDNLSFFAMIIMTYIPSVILLIYISAASDYVTE